MASSLLYASNEDTRHKKVRFFLGWFFVAAPNWRDFFENGGSFVAGRVVNL
jgi:hypothetical protein